jgi:hypothetical protein
MKLLVESVPSVVELTPAQADALSAAGKRLASQKSWWGAEPVDDADKTVIRVRPQKGDEWEVRVSDAVGAISIGDKAFLVQPKIPDAHLLYLFSHSGEFPRLDEQRAHLAAAKSLWDLVATWFVDAAEALLRRDLIRDYRGRVDDLVYVRGRTHPLPTVRALLKGRIAIRSEFDEFDADNAFNRTILAAAHRVAASDRLAETTRRRARRITLRLDGISALGPDDLRSKVDRRTRHYADTIALAKSILNGGGRTLRAGPEPVWTFLIRTPEMVEAGIRRLLKQGLDDARVTKEGHQLVGSTKTLNPDLVFDSGAAIADVKYKVTADDWVTSDLYQVVAFATGFRVHDAALISFSAGSKTLPTLQVGAVRVTHLVWDASPGTLPAEASRKLVQDVRRWLKAAKMDPPVASLSRISTSGPTPNGI